jgi:glycosyltransferase involved in cell wall biosynthesis
MRIAQLGDFDTYVCRGLERPRELLPVHQPTGLNLIRGFAELGQHEVHLVVTTKEVTKPTVEQGPFGWLHRLPQPPLSGSGSFHIWRRALILRELDRIKPDIVHGQGTEAEYAFTAVSSPYPNVVTLHGIMHRVHRVTRPKLLSTQHVARWLEKVVLARARDVICISKSVQEFVTGYNPNSRCHLIPNAVAPCFFSIPPPRTDGAFNLLFVGTIYRLKGLHDLIEALTYVTKRISKPIRLRIVGPQPSNTSGQDYVKGLRRRIRDLGLAGQVEWCGAKDESEVADALSQSDLLVLPSYEENLPMCVAEALAAGVPVVATKVGGIPELVADGINGLLVPPGDVSSLANTILQLLENESLRVQMARSAKQNASVFNSRNVAEATIEVYRNIHSSIVQSKPSA